MPSDVESQSPFAGARLQIGPRTEPSSAPEAAPVANRAVARHGAAPSDDEVAAASRRVWRSSTGALAAVIVFMVVAGLALPAAAVVSLLTGITAFGHQQVPVLGVICGVAAAVLFFGWRLALHPRLVLDDDRVTVVNPFRRRSYHLSDITLFAPGGDGLRIATADDEIEAWCVQKGTGAIKAGRRTRADRICDELWAAWDAEHPVDVDPRLAIRIRFARPGEEELLAGLERAAGLAAFGHIFPAEQFPFPENEVRRRWQSVLADRTRQTMIAESGDVPIGYASYGSGTLHHLGVSPDHQRRGVGTALLQAAEDELFADLSTPAASLWVMRENHQAQRFYIANGWAATEEMRAGEFPPYPAEIRMTRRNPRIARRGR
jgi:ribosomal protein S18 acetylase RimI-like enzyme